MRLVSGIFYINLLIWSIHFLHPFHSRPLSFSSGSFTSFILLILSIHLTFSSGQLTFFILLIRSIHFLNPSHPVHSLLSFIRPWSINFLHPYLVQSLPSSGLFNSFIRLNNFFHPVHSLSSTWIRTGKKWIRIRILVISKYLLNLFNKK